MRFLTKVLSLQANLSSKPWPLQSQQRCRSLSFPRCTSMQRGQRRPKDHRPHGIALSCSYHSSWEALLRQRLQLSRYRNGYGAVSLTDTIGHAQWQQFSKICRIILRLPSNSDSQSSRPLIKPAVLGHRLCSPCLHNGGSWGQYQSPAWMVDFRQSGLESCSSQVHEHDIHHTYHRPRRLPHHYCLPRSSIQG